MIGQLAATAAMVLVALGIGLAIGGCGGGDLVDPGDVTLTLAPKDVRNSRIPEKLVLEQVYLQALKQAGYRIKRAPHQILVDTRLASLESGQISGYPEHLSTSLHYDFGVEIEELPGGTHAAYEEALAGFEKKGLTAFAPTPFGVANAVGMLRTTAEERNLKTDSDLKGEAEEMTLKAPTYCHLSVDCLGGIERYYGTGFGGVTYEKSKAVELTWWRAEPEFRYKVLENGEGDASMLFTTDGRLAGRKSKFVILEDDKHAFPAGNVIWVTSPKVVDEAGPGYEKAIVAAQKGLTLKTMQELDAKVELGRSPAAVAREYLSSLGGVS